MLLRRPIHRRSYGAAIIGLLLVSAFIATFYIHPIVGEGTWWNYSWLYRKSISVDHTKVGTNLTDFSVLIDITDASLKIRAQTDGEDIAFADNSGYKLDHETETYDSGTGHLVAWVRLPTLSSTVNTTFYMYYGNPFASNQQNATGAWNSGYVMVQHLKETSGTSYDSTTNHNNGTPEGALNQNAAGKIDGADEFDGTDDYIDLGSDVSIDNLARTTVSAWIKMDAVGATVYDKGWTGGKSFYVHSGGPLCFVQGFTSGNPSPYGWWKTSTTLSAGSWYYVTVTYDASSDSYDPKFYINGASASVTEGNTPSGTCLSDAGYNGFIGGKTLYADGVIDEVRVSSVIRSDQWILAEYNDQNSPSTFYRIGNEETGTAPEAPWLTSESPQDCAADVALNPTLSVHATDFQGDLMNIIFSNNASGSWIELGRYTSVGNGTYTQTTSNMDNYGTKYYWRVSATDGTNWTNRTYSFATRSPPPPWWDPLWRYRKNITIDHSKVAGDLVDFSVLVDIVDADLAAAAQSNGNDVAFADCAGNKLDHEIESYEASSGHLVAWVRVPTLSSTLDTTFYIYYGNPFAPNQQNPLGVWDPNYEMVQHLEEGSGIRYDSTLNHNDGAAQGGMEKPCPWGDWVKYSGNPVLNPGHQCLVENILAEVDDPLQRPILYDGKYWLVYADTTNIRLAYSTDPDLLNWTPYATPVLTPGPGEYYVYSPDIFKDGSTYYLVYDVALASSHGSCQRIAYATASSPLGPYTKGDVILDIGAPGEFDDGRVAEPFVFKDGDTYYLFYMGDHYPYGNSEQIALATTSASNFPLGSSGGNWTKYGLILPHNPDSSAWDCGLTADPSVIKVGNVFYMLYTGSYANAHWKLGVAWATSPYGPWNRPPAPNVPLGPSGSWDSDRLVRGAIHYNSNNGKYVMPYIGNDGTGYRGGIATADPYDSGFGKINGANSFDGVDDYIDVGSDTSIDNIAQVTISAWIKPKSWGESGAGFILDKGFTSGKAFYIYNNPAGLDFVHGFCSGGTNAYGWWRWLGSITMDSWYHVTVTFDNTNPANDPKMYINGVSVPVTEGDTPSGTASSDSGFRGFIGSNQLGTHNFNGTIDELRLSSTIRSAAWIATEYSNQLNASAFYFVGSEEIGTTPQAPWFTDEHPGNRATDVQLNPILSVHAVDFQGDLMTIIFNTNTSGAWTEIGRHTNVGNGTYSQTTTGMNSYSTKYYWEVCVTDGSNWTNKTYSFTTRPENHGPSVSNPYPSDGETGIGFNPPLSVDVFDLDGDPLTVIFSTDASGSWQVAGTYVGGNEKYSQATSGIDTYHKTCNWRVNVSDGKAWTNITYVFTTWTEEDLYKQIGYYWCAGMPYAGGSKDKDTFYMIWFSCKHYPPTEDTNILFYAEFNRYSGWINGTVLYSSWLFDNGPSQGCPHYGYFGNQYHLFWSNSGGGLMTCAANEWSDFKNMTSGWYLLGSGLGDIDAWGSVYSLDNSHAITFFVKDYPVEGHTIVYWTWDETSGWSNMIPIWTTSTGGHDHYPHDCAGAVLLPMNKTTWYLYYVGGSEANTILYLVKSFDAGQTWGTPQIADVPQQPFWRTHRPSFARYGENFYMIMNVGGESIVCVNSTDGEHWGNMQTIHDGSWYVPQGVMLDQSHIVWTDSGLPWYPGTQRTGSEYGGVYEIPEMIANPGKPSDPYPGNAALLSKGTTETKLEVKVHGAQTYDVAFYWANGTFIGEDKLLREGDTASVEVSGLKDGEIYSWYAINRGTTYNYWGNEPATTSDENRSDTNSFSVYVQPSLTMNPSNLTCHVGSENFTVQINVSGAVNLHDYAFEINYNATVIDYASLTWGTFLNGAEVIDEINQTSGVIRGHIEPSTPTTGNGWLVSITFRVNRTILWKSYPGWVNTLEGAVWFNWTELSYAGGTYLRYENWAGGQRNITVTQADYTFVPIQGDVNINGEVDVFDLRTVTTYYHVKQGDPAWPAASVYDLNNDHIIDLFDLIIVATNYGFTYP